MKVEVKGDEIIITAKINKPLSPSASGKTLIVASSHGNQPTLATVDGKPIIVGLNCYVKK